MNLRLQSLLVALLMSSVVLAGCTDGGDADTDSVEGEGGIDPTKGGISGLLVDDNFRPLLLKEDLEDPQDFQDTGFILIEETGERIETTENGEFEVINLNPGTYTLRVAADNHEAIDKKVNVEAGNLASVTLEARRKATTDDLIVTTEYAIFIPCNAYATIGCTFDVSGDSFRPGISDNFSQYADLVTYSSWEILLNNPYIFCLEVRESGATGASLDRHFANWCKGQDSTYLKGILQKDEIYDEEYSRDPWDPTAETAGILFTFGNNEATCWQSPGHPSEAVLENPDGRYRCAGVSLAVKAQIVSSLFLYEPAEGEVEEYCVICAEE